MIVVTMYFVSTFTKYYQVYYNNIPNKKHNRFTSRFSGEYNYINNIKSRGHYYNTL